MSRIRNRLERGQGQTELRLPPAQREHVGETLRTRERFGSRDNSSPPRLYREVNWYVRERYVRPSAARPIDGARACRTIADQHLELPSANHRSGFRRLSITGQRSIQHLEFGAPAAPEITTVCQPPGEDVGLRTSGLDEGMARQIAVRHISPRRDTVG